jgi:hypothetical protein
MDHGEVVKARGAGAMNPPAGLSADGDGHRIKALPFS